MTPQFRQAIYNLPIYQKNTQEALTLGKSKKAMKMIMEIQRMMMMLQAANLRAWSSEDLTKSFGWHSNEGRDQQDIHELNRVLMDAIEQALGGTPYEDLVRALFYGE